MALSFTDRKRVRKTFGRIAEVAQLPNLIEVQRESYAQFLQMYVKHDKRDVSGLEAVFRSVFPITDFAETSRLEYVHYEFEEPKYDVDECRQRGMTFAAPLKVKLRLIVFEVDQETQAKSVKDIKEQDVYMGDMPLMTELGTFIVNGTERVIVSQMHRSPGVFFDHDKGKTHSSGKLLFGARVIPYRGSWLDFEFDAKDIIHVRIDRRRKLPATTLLYALGLTGEEILSQFYRTVMFKQVKDGWTTPFDAERMRNLKPTHDLKNAKTGDVVIEAGRKLTPRAARKLAEEGLKQLLLPNEELLGRYLALDMVNGETGEIYAEAGDEVTEKMLEELDDAGFDEIALLDIDHVNTGSFIRNTLNVDKNQSREQALIDIYRVMRPGEPPTLDTAETLFNGLFFDSERYDLSAVGRVKMNSRKTCSRSSRSCTTCATVRVKSTTSTTWRTAACARSVS
jgi:DNA-directed RNA polymerase subunit beta